MSFITGIILARCCQTVPCHVWLLLAITFPLLIILEKRFLPNRLWYINFHDFSRTSIALIIAMIFFGALRYSANLPQWTIYDLAWFNDTGIYEIVGRVVDPPELHNKYTLLQVDAHSLRPLNGVILSDGNHELKGTMLVRLPPDDSIRYADVLDFTGKLQTPSEGSTFSYRDYLATQGIYSYLNYPHYQVIMHSSGNLFKILIFAFRDQAYQKINQFYTQPEASLLSGILLGIETDISEDVEEAFQVTGTTHIIAISGFNIAIITGLFMFLARRVTKNRWKALIIAIIGICVYTTMVGGQASVVRAAIMGSIGLLGKQIGRPQSGVNSLAITAAIMSLFNPLILWDVGFQLSFAATIGLILYAEPLQTSFENITKSFLPENILQRISGPVGEFFLFTIAAQITTMPIIAYHFHQFSSYALLTNILILPAQPMIMILGGLSVLTGMILPPIGQLLAFGAWLFLTYTIRMVRYVSTFPGSLITAGEISIVWFILYYVVLFAVTLYLISKKSKRVAMERALSDSSN